MNYDDLYLPCSLFPEKLVWPGTTFDGFSVPLQERPLERIFSFNQTTCVLFSSLKEYEELKPTFSQTSRPGSEGHMRSLIRTIYIEMGGYEDKLLRLAGDILCVPDRLTENFQKLLVEVTNKTKPYQEFVPFLKTIKNLQNEKEAKIAANIRNYELHNVTIIERVHFPDIGGSIAPDRWEYPLTKFEANIDATVQLLVDLRNAFLPVLIGNTPDRIYGEQICLGEEIVLDPFLEKSKH